MREFSDFFFFLLVFGCWLMDKCTYKARSCFVGLALLFPQLICFFVSHLDKWHADFIRILSMNRVYCWTVITSLFPLSFSKLIKRPLHFTSFSKDHDICVQLLFPALKLEFTAKYLTLAGGERSIQYLTEGWSMLWLTFTDEKIWKKCILLLVESYWGIFWNFPGRICSIHVRSEKLWNVHFREKK